MASTLLSAGLLSPGTSTTQDAVQRSFRTTNNSYLSNRGGPASSSRGQHSHALATSSKSEQNSRHLRLQPAAAMIEPQIQAPDSAKPSSAGASAAASGTNGQL